MARKDAKGFMVSKEKKKMTIISRRISIINIVKFNLTAVSIKIVAF